MVKLFTEYCSSSGTTGRRCQALARCGESPAIFLLLLEEEEEEGLDRRRH
jgi:hypothetical protein